MKNGKRNEEITWFVGASDALDYFDLDNIIILDHHELGETSIDANFRVIDNDDKYENDTNEF